MGCSPSVFVSPEVAGGDENTARHDEAGEDEPEVKSRHTEEEADVFGVPAAEMGAEAGTDQEGGEEHDRQADAERSELVGRWISHEAMGWWSAELPLARNSPGVIPLWRLKTR